jgi:hypothetical protein
MPRHRLEFRSTPEVKLFLPGVVFLAGAVIGGGFEAAVVRLSTFSCHCMFYSDS